MKDFLLVGLGGMTGSIFRYSISKFFTQTLISFPIGTLLVNLIGCFFAGIIFKLTSNHFNDSFSNNLLNLLVIGFCGGFTTFSAFSIESITFFNQGKFLLLISYIMASTILGILFCGLGMLLIK
ncbi:MAG: fluoride efflux transporter CrcB [Flammeovirgaceae bacterium TMED290]|nr:MAG: fluoride efflux transporter CrcB [Flammeovirgaceae bacterium TMED290]|tara:strand:+ start:9738 stop:10109 length:372 start_codon:yes stop_codon:yes gene_type:complete